MKTGLYREGVKIYSVFPLWSSCFLSEVQLGPARILPTQYHFAQNPKETGCVAKKHLSLRSITSSPGYQGMATLNIPPGLKASESTTDQSFEELPAAYRKAVHAQCGLEDAAELSGLALV